MGKTKDGMQKEKNQNVHVDLKQNSRKEQTMDKKWTKEQLQGNIRKNFDYGATVVTAALYKKIYGELPKVGMSGQQAEFAEHIYKHLPKDKK